MSHGVVHIAGLDIQVGPYLRQRCAWCGAVLVDYDLNRLAFPVRGTQMEVRPATWPVGDLVLVDGPMSSVVEHTDGDPLPVNACGQLEPEVTR